MAFTQEEARKKQTDALLKTLEMYYRTAKNTEKRMREEKLADETPRFTEDDIAMKLREIEEGRQDVIAQYQFMGGDMDALAAEIKRIEELDKEETSGKKRKKPSISLDTVIAQNESKGNVGDKLAKAKKATQKKEEKAVKNETPKASTSSSSSAKVEKFIDKVDFIPKEYHYDPTVEFDTIPLPSKGQCYPSKNPTLAISPLNGYDENLMVSPNLYREGTLIDAILKRKVNNNIDINDLLDGDRDAAVLWLRATGYGNEYPVSLKDPVTGKDFDSVVDLSTINFKPFRLVGDDNGWFDFTLPISKDVVKFKFLSHRDKENLRLIEKMENTLIMKGDILTMSRTIDNFLENNPDVTEEAEEKLKKASKSIVDAMEDIDVSDVMAYTESLTNRMELSIMSINGNMDRDFISDYIKRMPAKDSWALRNYMTENEPGVDFSFEVQKPESLGGGSMPVFLSVNQFVFLNVSR